jgi:hypothetical protein
MLSFDVFLTELSGGGGGFAMLSGQHDGSGQRAMEAARTSKEPF